MSRDTPDPAFGRPPLDPDLFELDDVLWVLHCGEAPVPRASAAALSEVLEREVRPWRMGWEEHFLGLPRRTREAAARLLGAAAEDFTLTATTSSGLALVAQGFPWRAGDEVVVPLGEFPANAWPWKALASRGVTFREVPLWDGHESGAGAWRSAPPTAETQPEERLLAALGPRSRILSVSWVRFQDGLRLDLERLARGCAERGIHLVIDGIQGAGTLALELGRLEGAAAFACGGHKGLLAPQGLGLLWTSPAFRELLAPPGGWLSVEQAADFSRPSTDLVRAWARDGSRLELGVPNRLGCAALEASVSLLARTGSGRIETSVQRLQGRLMAGLAELPPWRAEARRLGELWQAGRLGAILALHHGRGPVARGEAGLGRLLAAGLERRIYASVREGYLRIALHGWHGDADVDRLLAWLAEAEAAEAVP